LFRQNIKIILSENAAFSSASIPQNHRQSRVHSRKRNYERESATREIEIGPNDRQTKLEERLRLAKEATQRSAMIEKAREEQIAVKEARLRKNREENNIKRKEQEHREQQEQQKQQQIEQQKLQEQRLKAQKTIIVEPDEFILEEVNPHAPGSDLFNTATLTNLEDVQIIEGGFEEIDESRFVYMPEQQIQDYAGPSHIQPQSLIYDHSTFEIQGIPAELNKVIFNPFGQSDQLVVHFSFAKNDLAKRRKKREAKLRVNNKNLIYFDAKLSFAHFASLRSAIFSETEMDNLLVTSPQGLNLSNLSIMHCSGFAERDSN